MLVVHPQDRTTDVLQLLYEGLEAKVITKECSNRMMGQFLHNTSIRDRIMLLGHGSERGLITVRMMKRKASTASS